ncbi:chaplin family protein [Nocardiopsis valliformis]|uniref:chaplin family protein n=1 Tax=Nocardiopsis valliformis TaxID=239974 RepID=UPI000347AD42|nr:chaplin family protein [Nocardiopsis valliformis]
MTQTTHLRLAAVLAAGFIVTSHGVALADTTTSGNGSIGGGNQVVLDVDAPVNACGNAIAVLGVAGANCTGGDAKVTETKTPKDPYPGYEGYDPEEPEEEPEEEEPVEEEPEEEPREEEPEEEEPVEEGPEEEEEREEQAEEEKPSPEPSASASPSAPPADESRLAVTGTDQSALAGLLAAAVLAVAAGAGLLLFGKRRRARA